MRRRFITVAAALALALPAVAATAQPEALLERELLDQREVAVQVRAAAEAAKQYSGQAVQRHSGGERTVAGSALVRDTARQLDDAAEQLVADGAVGVTARVESPGLLWAGSAGSRQLDRRPPARPHDQFRVASITKTMVATVVMQEVQAGTFALDTPVNEIVPGLFPAQPDVTVEHLLTHRSGASTGTDVVLAMRMEDPSSWEEFVEVIGQDVTAEDYLAVVNALPWLFEPGSDVTYSNAGYVALGVILEEATGKDLEDLLEQRVFRPTRMRHTSYPDEPSTRGPLLVGAAWTGTEAEGGVGWLSLTGFDPDVFGAAGAAISSTRDLNQFTEALLAGELLDPALVAEMVTPRTVGSDLLPDYGLGIYRVPDPCTPPGDPQEWLYGHDGGSYGTVSMALSSADGSRQLSFGMTGRSFVSAGPPLEDLLVPMLLATCSADGPVTLDVP